MTEPITLFVDKFWISPYVFSAFVALHEKGIAFETATLSVYEGEHRGAEYRDRSVTGRVPALRHGDFWVAESSAIVEYLEETFPNPRVLPASIPERARARQVMAWVRSDLMAIRDERPTSTMFYARAPAPLSTAGVEAVERLLHAASMLVPDGRTSMFAAWSIADADLAMMLERLILNGHDVGPKLRAFADTQWSRPSVRAFVERERLPYVGP